MGDSALEGPRHTEQAVASGSIPPMDMNHLGDSCGGDQVLGAPGGGAGPFSPSQGRGVVAALQGGPDARFPWWWWWGGSGRGGGGRDAVQEGGLGELRSRVGGLC